MADRKKKRSKEIYISCDVEADGPIPGPNSMLNFGAAAFLDAKMVDTFGVNLEQLKDATPDPDTLAWWKKQPEAWEAVRKYPESPKTAMIRFVKWFDLL